MYRSVENSENGALFLVKLTQGASLIGDKAFDFLLIIPLPDFLRQIQHLPERVTSCFVYILSGLLPIVAETHKPQLTLFCNIIRQDCVERDLAI